MEIVHFQIAQRFVGSQGMGKLSALLHFFLMAFFTFNDVLFL